MKRESWQNRVCVNFRDTGVGRILCDMANYQKRKDFKRKSTTKQVVNLTNPDDYLSQISLCQNLLKKITIFIMASIVMIIVLTTISTGSLVQLVGKSLYLLVLGAAFASLIIWALRMSFQRKFDQAVCEPAEKTR